MLSSPWLVTPRPNPSARARLFCFAYAGGGASIFSTWPQALPPSVEVVAVQLPGRENRFLEPALSDLPAVVRHVADAVGSQLDRPYMLFGHSLGGLIAYELVRTLQTQLRALPLGVLISGKRAPQLPARLRALSRLPDDELIRELENYKGTPASVLENRELMELILPRLRADATLFDDYCYEDRGLLPCPITAFGGTDDAHVSVEELLGWSELTDEFGHRLFDGDHFFIHSHRDEVLGAVADVVEGWLSLDPRAQHCA